MQVSEFDVFEIASYELPIIVKILNARSIQAKTCNIAHPIATKAGVSNERE